MMRVLSPTYEIRVTVKDPYVSQHQNIQTAGEPIPNGHKYFDSQKGKTGCDEAMAAVKDALFKAGINAEIWLEQFKHS